MSWWSDHPEKSIGRIIHFIYTYCGLHIAESVTVGEKEVSLNSQKIAEVITWEDFELDGVKVNIPKLKFYDEHYNKAQNDLHKYAVITLNEFAKKADSKWIEIYLKVSKELKKVKR